MSRIIKIKTPLTIGNNRKINADRNRDHCSIDMSKVFDKNRCVIHLIDTENYKFDMINESDNPDNDHDYEDDCDDYENCDEDRSSQKITGEQITKFINDQHVKLWNMMKRGDLIEDLAVTRYYKIRDNMQTVSGRYIVDCINIDSQDKDSKIDAGKMAAIDIIQNGLCVRDLCFGYDSFGSILPSMLSPTQFSFDYFLDSNLIVNDVLCPGQQFRSEWCRTKNIVFIDTKNLQNLETHNIKTIKINVKVNFNETKFHVYYLYVKDDSVKPNVVYVSRYSEEYFEYDHSHILNMFIKQFKDNTVFELDNTIDDPCVKNILSEIATSENVLEKNVILI